jgi:hypothetical protein
MLDHFCRRYSCPRSSIKTSTPWLPKLLVVCSAASESNNCSEAAKMRDQCMQSEHLQSASPSYYLRNKTSINMSQPPVLFLAVEKRCSKNQAPNFKPKTENILWFRHVPGFSGSPFCSWVSVLLIFTTSLTLIF